MTRRWMGCGIVMFGLLLCGVAFAQQPPGAKPAAVEKGSSEKSPAEKAPALGKGPNELDELALKQSRVADKYSRLEELLSRMATFEAGSNPRRAALLKQALAQSKDRLTLTQLNKVVALLNQNTLDKALDGQGTVDKDLKSLLELLQSENRADRLKSEQARIKEYIKEVERLLRLERGIQGQTEGGADPKQLAEEQQKIAERTGDLAQKIIENEEGGQKKSEGQDNQSENSSDKKKDGQKSENGEDPKKDSKADDKDGKKNDSKHPQKDPSDKKEPNSKDGNKQDSGKQSEQNSKPKSDSSKSDGAKKDDKNQDGKKDPENKDPSKEDKQSKEDPQGKNDKDKKGNDKKDDKKDPKDSSKQDSPSKQSEPKDGKPSQQDSKPQDSKQQQDQKGGQDQKDQQQAQNKQDKQQDNPARKRIQAAEEKMREAERKLAEAKRKEAIEEQEKAKEELEKAKAALEEILRQMREEEIERTLAQLEGRFKKMLEMQLKVYESTKRLDKIPIKQRGDEVTILSGRLASDERRITFEADKALNLLREEGSSIALPETVEQMRDDMEQVAARLDRTEVGTITQNVEEDIIAALEEIIDALRKAQQDQENKKQQQQQQQQQGGEQTQPLVDKIAELKMIRSLQLRVNKRTQRFAKLLDNEEDATGNATDPDLRQALGKLGEREDSIQRITRDIVLGKNK